MNCENCETELLALLYGELDATTAARVREHSEGCASCGAARMKLESARKLVRPLAMVEAPTHIHAAIMERAQAHLRGEVVVAAPKGVQRAAARGADGPLQRFLGWLGGFVLGPQVAMALMLMLMVGVGLYYLPGLRSSRHVQGGAIVNVDPGDEAGPSAAIQPAAPLDLRLDKRTNRLTSGEGPVVTRAPRTEPTPAATNAEGVVVDGPLPADPTTTLVELPPPAELRALESEAPSGQVIDDALEPASIARRATTGEVLGGQRSPTTGTLAEAQTTAREEPIVAADAERDRLAQAAPPQAPPPPALLAPAAPSPPPPSAVAPAAAMRQQAPTPMTRQPAQAAVPARGAPASPSTDRYGAGGGADSTANTDNTANTGSITRTDGTAPQAQAQSPLLLAAALHGMARNQATANALRDAISSYESLLSRYPSYDRAGDAMLELAELYRRVGDLARARSWVARTERMPAYEVRARQQRFRIDEMDRARSSVPAAAPSGL